MALINCPECGREISDKAVTCINCGYPLNVSVESKCIVRATACDFGVGSFELGIYDKEDNELATLRVGTSTTFHIKETTSICVKYKKKWISKNFGTDFSEKMRNRLASNFVVVHPQKTTYLEISYIQENVFSEVRLNLSEVGMVDSN